MSKDNLVEFEGKWYPLEVVLAIRHADMMVEHFDLLQLTKKIAMNSFYGALLAKGFRWGLKEMIGASTTYTGRAITSHMIDTAARLLTGVGAGLKKAFELVKDGPVYKVKNLYTAENESIIYGDTDSCYFQTMGEDVDDAVMIADATAEGINESFQEFSIKSFFCQDGYDTLVKAGREIVAIRALFQARKKYIAKCVDIDGFRLEEPKIKAMGSEIKKSDTPKVIQKFLKSVLDKILDGVEYKGLTEYVNKQRKVMFKEQINASEIILLGTTKSANKLDYYIEIFGLEKLGTPRLKPNSKIKVTIPGHVRAAIHYNMMIEKHEDTVSPRINNGDKVKVFQLKPNPEKFETIAFPAELKRFPIWFSENFEINMKLSEEKLITNKLEGIFSSMGLEVPSPQLSHVTSIVQF